MENCLGIIILENLISVTRNNVFGINFAIISGWGVLHTTPVNWRCPSSDHLISASPCNPTQKMVGSHESAQTTSEPLGSYEPSAPLPLA